MPGNGESYFVAQCFKRLARLGIQGVLSFSDPIPRTDLEGRVVMPGHIGTVYQALGVAGPLATSPDPTASTPRLPQLLLAAGPSTAGITGPLPQKELRMNDDRNEIAVGFTLIGLFVLLLGYAISCWMTDEKPPKKPKPNPMEDRKGLDGLTDREREAAWEAIERERNRIKKP